MSPAMVKVAATVLEAYFNISTSVMVYKVLKPISSFFSLKENSYSTSAFQCCSYVYSDPFSGCKDILSDSQDCGVLYIPGVMTPTEILSAYNAGAKIVKVYPVSTLGGTHYISALKKPFPHICMVASQGIPIGLAGEYIAKGASAVVLSDAIFSTSAMAQCNLSEISKCAHIAALQGREAVDRRKRCLE